MPAQLGYNGNTIQIKGGKHSSEYMYSKNVFIVNLHLNPH